MEQEKESRINLRGKKEKIEEELERVAEGLVGTKCSFEAMICNEPKGIKINDMHLNICGGEHTIVGYAITENPEFWASSLWGGGATIRYQGKYVILEIEYGGVVRVYALLRVL
jgi:hypothetical protein